MAKYESFFLISSHLFSMHKIIIMFSRIFTNGLDHPTRHTHYDGICRNIMRNNSAASDNAIISDCYPGIIMALKPICTLLPIRIFPKRSISDNSGYL